MIYFPRCIVNFRRPISHNSMGSWGLDLPPPFFFFFFFFFALRCRLGPKAGLHPPTLLRRDLISWPPLKNPVSAPDIGVWKIMHFEIQQMVFRPKNVRLMRTILGVYCRERMAKWYEPMVNCFRVLYYQISCPSPLSFFHFITYYVP